MTTPPKLTIEPGPTPAETIIRLDGVPVGGIQHIAYNADVYGANPYSSIYIHVVDGGANSKQIEVLRQIPGIQVSLRSPFVAKTIPSNIADTEQEEIE